jgi:hypothetical protein
MKAATSIGYSDSGNGTYLSSTLFAKRGVPGTIDGSCLASSQAI